MADECGVDLIQDTPRKLREITDVAAMVRTLEDTLCDSTLDILSIADLNLDATKIPDKFLQQKLANWGFKLECLDLTPEQIRKLIDGLIPVIYRWKGTLGGIVNLIRLLLGLEVTAEIESADIGGGWEIGFGEIGDTTIIGIDDPASFLIITSTVPLTDLQVANILCLVDYMRVAGTEVILEYPNKVELDDFFWRVGIQLIGDMTNMGSSSYDAVYENNYPQPGTGRVTFAH